MRVGNLVLLYKYIYMYIIPDRECATWLKTAIDMIKMLGDRLIITLRGKFYTANK